MKQLSLFPLSNQQFSQPESTPKNEEAIEEIRGLQYIADYITESQHDWLLEAIDKQQWSYFGKRRVQHYGQRYDYSEEKKNDDLEVSEFPEWLERLCLKLRNDGHMPKIANQVLISEYQSGQGIGDHTDKEACFMDTICILSLSSSCVMNLTLTSDKTQKIPIWLAPGSLTVLSADAKNKWMHGIPTRKTDVWDDRKYASMRRVSLRFRRLI
ncbi:MAG: alpha-ketoglutarate-dependent dioxygenase AlkB [Candidatus Poribacteria bacterium]|nr:alpha-ketoglutarate-dependent dioxygenase AlkB [Candidatus Poribacteria bacterium]